MRREFGGSKEPSVKRRFGFTLIELLIVLAIIGVLTSMLIVMLSGYAQESNVRRTQNEVSRIESFLSQRWEEIATRPVAFSPAVETYLAAIVNNADPDVQKTFASEVQLKQLEASREIQRSELPDRRSDLAYPQIVTTPNGLWGLYRLRVESAYSTSDWNYILNGDGDPAHKYWTRAWEGAECLYLVLSTQSDEEGSFIRFFSQSEIGDTDGDLMPEILDSWGNPIEFLRWAPGFRSPRQDLDRNNSPDPFDQFKLDPRWSSPPPVANPAPFVLYPLVFSAGPDRRYSIYLTVNAVHSSGPVRVVEYPALVIPNDPYVLDNSDGLYIGTPTEGYEDNIHNHQLFQQ